jgi:OOP family OmpA-OmpF porin
MKRKILVAGIVLASTAPLAMAAEDVGPYIGANFGFTSVDAAVEVQKTVNDIVALGYTSASMTLDEKSSGGKILGGYQFNENFALEGYWASLGTYNFTLATTGPTLSASGDFKVTAIGIDVLGIYPFDPSASGFIRIGYYQADVKTSIGFSGGPSTSDTNTSSDAKFGLGGEWKMTPAVHLRAEWEYYNDSDTPISVLSVGITSHF